MAAVIGSPPGFQELFTNISSKFNPAESEDVVQSLKRNYGGKFETIDNQDLLSTLQLLLKHGFVSENKLTLIEEFVAPKSSQKEQIKEIIKSFKDSQEQQVDSQKELPGRQDEITKISKKLETKGQSLVVNLFGSAGVGKTTLAKRVCSKWQGKFFVCDLREAKNMKAIYLNMMSSLGLTVRIGYIDQNSVVTNIHEKIQVLNQPVLFLLDNVEQFTTGQGKEGKKLKTAFVQFLVRLSEFDEKDKKTSLKLLLTSRTHMEDAKMVDNFEVKPLESSLSEEILISRGMVNVNTHQKNKLINISKGIPLLLNGLAAILRQERKAADDLIAGIDKGKDVTPTKSKLKEERTFNFEEEGVDIGQFSTIREMFNSLPTDSLKVSAVSISSFCAPFSASTAAKILGLSPSEALVLLEGLVTSAIIFVVNEEAKEVMYDIHPLLKKYADSIKEHENFRMAYLEAKGRFHQHFMARMEKIAKLIEPDYIRAFRLFETDRANYEFTVEISLQSDYFSIPGEFLENTSIASLFTAMLTEEKQIKLFHSWAEMCEDDGRSGSLSRAQLKCWEARQVLDVDGTEKAFEVLKEASCSLEKVQDKSSASFRLSKGLLLYFEGEIYCRKRSYRKALGSLESSLQFSEELLKVHTDLARCYNAIGNCHFHLHKLEKAFSFYNIAYGMQEELAGSEYHFDIPMYKNQIGTVHEGLGDYEKAVQYYRDALRLLEELNLSGFHDEAHFCRNLANSLMFLKKYSEAVEPADRAYKIRMKLLENHPLTVRSIFQRAVLQANFGEFEKALELFLEAWEMEKSLGAGHHSVVWRKIITGVEDMYKRKKESKLKRFLPPFRDEKEQFRKDALEFCQRFWDEERRSGQFSFTDYNREIIDALLQLVRDKKEKNETEKKALWFYVEMQRASEAEFQEEFDQETDNSLLNEMLQERDEFLNKVIKLCDNLHEHEKLTKHKRIKLALYKKVLERPDFVGEKNDGYDKATLKIKVEQLYRKAGKEEYIPEFQESLLSTWQTQWEEGKGGEKLKEFGVARERTIKGILSLCKDLKKKEMFRRYGKEALSFYENVWEVRQALMEPPQMKQFLCDVKEIASTIGDHERKKIYDNALQALKRTGKHPGATLRKKAEQPTSKSAGEEEKEEEDEEKSVVGSEEEDEDVSQEDIVVDSGEDVVGSDEESEVESESETDGGAEGTEAEDISLILEDTVYKQGSSHWQLKKVAAHVIFPPDAVSKDTLMALYRWKSSACSPPLQENEAIVSDVVELSAGISERLTFNKEVTLAISHSASDLKGYEVVIKTLIDKDTNEWVDVDKTVGFRSLSDLEQAYGSDFPDYLLPVAETKINQCSTFVVVCRLKSYMFNVTSESTSLSLPDYPLVKVIIPENAVHATEILKVTVKVQEFPKKEIKRKKLLAGPILRISCDREVEFQEPVILQLPLSLREMPDIPDSSLVRARVLFQLSDGESREWTEITDSLESPPSFDGNVITFRVRHFSGFWSWLEWCATSVVQFVSRDQAPHSGIRQGNVDREGEEEEGGRRMLGGRVEKEEGRGAETEIQGTRAGSQTIQIAGDYNTECVRHAVVFTACLPANVRILSTSKLSLYCSPNDKRRQLIDKEDEVLLEEESSRETMRDNDMAYVFLSEGVVRPDKPDRLKDLVLKFQKADSFKTTLKVQVIDHGELTIEFYSSQAVEKENLLCRLEMDLPPPTKDTEKTPVEFFGVHLDDSDLTDAPLTEMLAKCKGVLQEIHRGDIYERHDTGSSKRADVTDFFKDLARLSLEDQQMCFNSIVGFLKERGKGVEHVADRLLKAQALVSTPPDESLRSLVAERVGRSWRKLASKLKVKEAVMDSIEEERRDWEDCCCMALKTWIESSGSQATVRELMWCLTDMGYSIINWLILKELDLLTVEKLQQLRVQNLLK